MSNAPNLVKKYLIRAAKIFAALILVYVAVVVCVLYIDWSAEKKARAFCDGIAIGSDISTAIERATDGNTLHGPHEGNYGGHTFYFPGVVFSKAVCEVSVSSEGRVTAKASSMERD